MLVAVAGPGSLVDTGLGLRRLPLPVREAARESTATWVWWRASNRWVLPGCSSFFGNSAPYAAAIERSVSPNQFNPPPAGFSAQSFSRPRWRVPGEL